MTRLKVIIVRCLLFMISLCMLPVFANAGSYAVCSVYPGEGNDNMIYICCDNLKDQKGSLWVRWENKVLIDPPLTTDTKQGVCQAEGGASLAYDCDADPYRRNFYGGNDQLCGGHMHVQP